MRAMAKLFNSADDVAETDRVDRNRKMLDQVVKDRGKLIGRPRGWHYFERHSSDRFLNSSKLMTRPSSTSRNPASIDSAFSFHQMPNGRFRRQAIGNRLLFPSASGVICFPLAFRGGPCNRSINHIDRAGGEGGWRSSAGSAGLLIAQPLCPLPALRGGSFRRVRDG